VGACCGDLPPRSIEATVGGEVNTGQVEEGLAVSPIFPKHLLIARSLGKVGPNQEVFTQVMNISPDVVTLYKGVVVT
jgi:hypothetical protein